MLAYWVRERQIMSLEDAIKKLTFLPASIFGIHDRGLLRRGMAADIFVFDPAKIDLAEPEKVTDLPEGAPRYIQRAKGIHYTSRQRLRPDEKRRPYGRVSGESAAKCIKNFG